ncbi:hypothetical protein ACFQ8T_12500 [Isoptericola sp. NPDC056618]|uniref:hypothetical protein n=1 Tax=Isoptericola sp. NPDC056618 TaxID=3345878 RepID=UPI0036B92344
MSIDTLAPADAAALLEHEVRELVRRRALDPVRDRAGLERLVAEASADYTERATRGVVPALADPQGTARAVVDALGGLGPLQRYLDDPEVEEIWINSTSSGIGAGRRVFETTQSARSPHACNSPGLRPPEHRGRRLR